MAALTPALTLAVLRLSSSMNAAPIPSRRSPCFTCSAFRAFRLQPPHARCGSFLTLPLSSTALPFPAGFGLRLHPWLAGSSSRKAESSLLSLRTALSPPIASDPISWWRPFVRLQAGERMPGEDFHLAVHARSQAH